VNGRGEARLRRIEALRKEMSEWVDGRLSHMNEFIAVEGDPGARQATLVAVAQADAAEVQSLSAAIQAEAALAESLGWSE